jgi:hypothetical protein
VEPTSFVSKQEWKLKVGEDLGNLGISQEVHTAGMVETAEREATVLGSLLTVTGTSCGRSSGRGNPHGRSSGILSLNHS